MSLKALMQKFSSAGPATATPATVATEETNKTRTAATVATVAVAEGGSALAPVAAKPIDLAAFYERAAIMEHDGGLPARKQTKLPRARWALTRPKPFTAQQSKAWRSEIATAPQTGIPGFDKLAP